MRQLYFGDNLSILREHLDDESVDLIYLDPPFNSRRDYSVLFKSAKGNESHAQIMAFEDTWHWGQASEDEYDQILKQEKNGAIKNLIGSLRLSLGETDTLAYLVAMTIRLLELHRVLKKTGTLYLHCDPTASHYLKIILDSIFRDANFKNEVIWKRINAKGNVQRKFGAIHDTLLVYAKKAGKEIWHQLYRPLDPEYVGKMYRYTEEGTGRRYRLGDLTAPMQRASRGQIYEWKGKRPHKTRCWVYAKERMEELEKEGRIIYSNTGYPQYKRYLDEQKGEKLPDIWDDIKPAMGHEYRGYPTQKPLALLERIIAASSDKGDVVLDPFCGCGTAIHAAEKLERQWIGIDITHLAITEIENRMFNEFSGLVVDVEGTPTDKSGAVELARRGKRYEFEYWACSLVHATPQKGKVKGKKGTGPDRGIDGEIISRVDGKDYRILVSIKSGKAGISHVRELIAVVDREKAAFGLLIELHEPTPTMTKDALSGGFVNYESERLPKIQILTIKGLLDRVEHPIYPGALAIRGRRPITKTTRPEKRQEPIPFPK